MIEIGVSHEAIVQIAYPEFADFRWQAYLQLDLEGMDGILALLLEEWAEVYDQEAEASIEVRVLQEGHQDLEASLHIAVEGDVVGKSAGERDEHRKSLVRGKFEWQESNSKLLEAKNERDKLTTKLAELDKRLGVLQARIAWRRQTVALLTRLPDRACDIEREESDELVL